MRFAEVWANFDPDATYWIPAASLAYLIQRLEPPLGTLGLSWNRSDVQSIVMSLDIPEHGGRVRIFFWHWPLSVLSYLSKKKTSTEPRCTEGLVVVSRSLGGICLADLHHPLRPALS